MVNSEIQQKLTVALIFFFFSPQEDTKKELGLRSLNKDRLIYFSIAAAAAAKSIQSCLTLCHPVDSSPPGSAVPELLQARTLEWVAISFSSA